MGIASSHLSLYVHVCKPPSVKNIVDGILYFTLLIKYLLSPSSPSVTIIMMMMIIIISYNYFYFHYLCYYHYYALIESCG